MKKTKENLYTSSRKTEKNLLEEEEAKKHPSFINSNSKNETLQTLFVHLRLLPVQILSSDECDRHCP
ncbi:hypothetical protein CEXT_609621 [Caerostris extrusa]|uniref:Uncharacterized protein n=1 Tax=Caerostris extrusa TaxID=172846 RepID=A0AAV4QY38_CAEEX|nr:hypothetical protein CEXT_609621 [Caerostris extrusa]